jgi:hypothetical protein
MTCRSKIIKSILIIVFLKLILIGFFYAGIQLFINTESIAYRILEILILIMILFIHIIIIDFQYYNIKWNIKKIKNEKNNNSN